MVTVDGATRERHGNGSGRRPSSLDVQPLLLKDFLVMGVSAILNALQLLTSTKALAYVAVSTPVVFRTAVILLCAGIGDDLLWEAISAPCTCGPGGYLFWDAGVRSAGLQRWSYGMHVATGEHGGLYGQQHLQ